MQPPLQTICVPTHIAEQWPPRQTWLAEQTVPHIPQFWKLLRRMVQTPLQLVSPVGQVHVPAEQKVPPVQATPHAPQLLPLVLGSMQAPLQSVWEGGQAVMQEPLLQTLPVPQT